MGFKDFLELTLFLGLLFFSRRSLPWLTPGFRGRPCSGFGLHRQ